jgi:hypothetical protein
MYNLERLTLSDMALASTRLRKLGQGARSMEEAAARIVRFLYDEFGVPESRERGCVLVRLYKTHRFADLPPDLQAFASQAAQAALGAHVPCLVLLGTVGVEAAWCARQRSQGHRAIPLPSVEAVARLPMVAQLVSQLGYDVAPLLKGTAVTLLEAQERTFNVFHVPEAAGSPCIPAQSFVEHHGVKSVLGCGGQLPDGNLYAIIAFSRVPVSRETAETFKPLALAAKLALLPFLEATFDGSADAARV